MEAQNSKNPSQEKGLLPHWDFLHNGTFCADSNASTVLEDLTNSKYTIKKAKKKMKGQLCRLGGGRLAAKFSIIWDVGKKPKGNPEELANQRVNLLNLKAERVKGRAGDGGGVMD